MKMKRYRAEVRFKSALSNACSIKLNNGTFYLDKQSYTPSQGEKDAKKRKQNIAFFNNHLYKDILDKEEKLRKDVRKYPELKEYRKGGNRQKNKLPVWVAFSYFELGTVTMMYNYLRGDFRRAILVYAFGKVHDELIIECREDVSLDAICEQMGRTPPWAEGLVLRADGYCTRFYKKE